MDKQKEAVGQKLDKNTILRNLGHFFSTFDHFIIRFRSKNDFEAEKSSHFLTKVNT